MMQLFDRHLIRCCLLVEEYIYGGQTGRRVICAQLSLWRRQNDRFGSAAATSMKMTKFGEASSSIRS